MGTAEAIWEEIYEYVFEYKEYYLTAREAVAQTEPINTVVNGSEISVAKIRSGADFDDEFRAVPKFSNQPAGTEVGELILPKSTPLSSFATSPYRVGEVKVFAFTAKTDSLKFEQGAQNFQAVGVEGRQSSQVPFFSM